MINNTRVSARHGVNTFGENFWHVTIDGIDIGHPAGIPWNNLGWWQDLSNEALDAIRNVDIKQRAEVLAQSKRNKP